MVHGTPLSCEYVAPVSPLCGRAVSEQGFPGFPSSKNKQSHEDHIPAQPRGQASHNFNGAGAALGLPENEVTKSSQYGWVARNQTQSV